jgi:serine protease Do
MTSTLSQLQDELRGAASPVRAATVSLGRDGRGSGVVVADGVVLTNAHVLRDRTISVRFADGRTAQGTVSGIDADGDLAAIAVDTTGTAPLTWAEVAGDSGSLVLAGHGNGTVTMGMVSAVGRRFRGPRGRVVSDTVEHTAPLSRGASGGPVVNIDGRLIGINTARSDSGYRAVAVSGDLRTRIDRLVAGENVERPMLGISIWPNETECSFRRSRTTPPAPRQGSPREIWSWPRQETRWPTSTISIEPSIPPRSRWSCAWYEERRNVP